MNPQIDLAGPILAAIAGLPAQAIAAYSANPDAWNRVGLGMLALAALSILGSRIGRRRRRRA